MSKQILEWFGSVPCDEDCAQIGQDINFDSKNLGECSRFRSLLAKAYPPPEGAYIQVKGEDHNFGRYREVVISQDESVSDEDQEKINQWVEKISNHPSTWIELEQLANPTIIEGNS
jgi:hypothetical protein